MIEHFKSDEYKWLSNMEPCKIIIDNIEYASVEHAYVSAKSSDPEWKMFCKTEPNPRIIKRKGRELVLSPEWNTLKLSVMKQCIDQKYSQEPYRELLLSTGNEYIQEGNWWNDRFWGVDLKSDPPVGNNMLGKLIMEKRDSLLLESLF